MKRMLLTLVRCVFFTALFLGTVIIIARLLFPAPSLTDRKLSKALPPATQGALAAKLADIGKDHQGLTGIASLQDGRDAFATRILLANAAVSSIDVQ